MTLDEAMSTEPFQMALQMGLHEGRLRSAMKRYLEKTGKPFQNAEMLVEAVLDGQFDEEDGDTEQQQQPLQTTRIPTFRDDHSIVYDQRSTATSGVTPITPTENNRSTQLDNHKTNQLTVESKKQSEQQQQRINDDIQFDSSDLSEHLTLEEENRKLKDARLCKVCMDAEVGVVFLPCGHLVTCVQCAPGVTMCPLCRSQIKGFVRTFLS